MASTLTQTKLSHNIHLLVIPYQQTDLVQCNVYIVDFLDAISISIVGHVGPSVSQSQSGTIFEIYEYKG